MRAASPRIPFVRPANWTLIATGMRREARNGGLWAAPEADRDGKQSDVVGAHCRPCDWLAPRAAGGGGAARILRLWRLRSCGRRGRMQTLACSTSSAECWGSSWVEVPTSEVATSPAPELTTPSNESCDILSRVG